MRRRLTQITDRQIIEATLEIIQDESRCIRSGRDCSQKKGKKRTPVGWVDHTLREIMGDDYTISSYQVVRDVLEQSARHVSKRADGKESTHGGLFYVQDHLSHSAMVAVFKHALKRYNSPRKVDRIDERRLERRARRCHLCGRYELDKLCECAEQVAA